MACMRSESIRPNSPLTNDTNANCQALHNSQQNVATTPVKNAGKTEMQHQNEVVGCGLAPNRICCFTAICPRATALRPRSGMAVKPSRVGKDGPTHPPLKQNGHHCDNLISDVRHRHVKFKHLLELKTVQTVCQNNLNTSTSVEQLTQHRFAKQFWVYTNSFSLNPSINPKAA